MPDREPDVKGLHQKLMRWIDEHPRTGWYVSVVVTLNLLVTVVGLFH